VGFVSSLKRFVSILLILIVVALSITFVFDTLLATPLFPEVLIRQEVRTVIVIVFASAIILFIRRSKMLMSKRIGVYPTMIFQFFLILIISIIAVFDILSIFEVSATTLLVSGGIVSIVIGLVISTFVGNILAGALVLVTNPFRIGDAVLINNVPGRVEDINALVTRIRNDVGGQIVIPNTAIVQGGVIVTRIAGHETVVHSRLPYNVGDRIYTTYMSSEGEVKEVTPLHTKILLDSGRELTFLNNTVLAGLVAVAKVTPAEDGNLKFSFKIDWDPEKTVEAIRNAVNSDRATFKTVPTILYSSLDTNTIELEVNCKVDPAKKSEAKNMILKAAYTAKTSR
jgi:small-conductance mechanosensitive channel